MKRILTIAGLLFGWLLALPALAQTVTLNFDDGTAGSLVGGHYSAQGITFQDASWVEHGKRTSGHVRNDGHQPCDRRLPVGAIHTGDRHICPTGKFGQRRWH
ncbi:MAG: hypothetical protein V9G22_17015 [Ottowia sp.]